MRIKLKIRTNVRREGKKNKVAVLSHSAATLFRVGHYSASITLIIPQSAVKCNVPFRGNCLLTRRVNMQETYIEQLAHHIGEKQSRKSITDLLRLSEITVQEVDERLANFELFVSEIPSWSDIAGALKKSG